MQDTKLPPDPSREPAGPFLYIVCTLMSIMFRWEWSGLFSKNPQQMSFISSSYKMIPRTTKGNLANEKRRKAVYIFFIHIAPNTCKYPHKLKAAFKTRYSSCCHNL